jgi:hypothetical protein
MADQTWTDIIVGDRMAVDQEFNDRVTASEFSRQEWGLIMTAVEFEIENPGDAEAARIVANTSKLEHVMPELENIKQQMNPMGGGPADNSGGFFSSVKSALGFGGGGGEVDEQKSREAERLAQEYADELQAHLEEQGKWSQVRRAASE